MSRPGNSDTATSTGPAVGPAAVSAPPPHDRRNPRLSTGSAADAVPLAGQPGHGSAAFLRNQPVRSVDGRIHAHYNGVYELICPHCGDDPDLDYSEVAPRLQWLRGPRSIAEGLAAYHQHLGKPWAEKGRAGSSGPGEPTAGQGPVLADDYCSQDHAGPDRGHAGGLSVICGCLAIPLARLAAPLSAAGLCLVQPARVRRAASAWNGGTPQRAFGETRGSARRRLGDWPSAAGMRGAWYGSRHLGITCGCRTSLRHLSRCRHDRGESPRVISRACRSHRDAWAPLRQLRELDNGSEDDGRA
jgi:hypothetical protein